MNTKCTIRGCESNAELMIKRKIGYSAVCRKHYMAIKIQRQNKKMRINKCSYCRKKILGKENEREYDGKYYHFFPCWMIFYDKLNTKKNEKAKTQSCLEAE